MIIKDATGIKMSEALDWLIKETMERHDIDRRSARKLLGETLVRTCVINEIFETADCLVVAGRGKHTPRTSSESKVKGGKIILK